MNAPRVQLNSIQAARKTRDLGGLKQVSKSGTHGIRKRASWCGKRDMMTAPKRAEYARILRMWKVGDVGPLVKTDQMDRMYAGPRSKGRLTRKCWYLGCRPWLARLEESEL